jgi:HK97 family phage portal protein
MGFWDDVFSPVATLVNRTSQRDFSASVPVWQNGVAQFPNNRYETYAREGYMKNEVVYQCIDELATSAAEPKMMARSGDKWRADGQICELLNAPNPFMDRFTFWATVIMHLCIAGNAYALKVRSGSGRVVELWLLRPDRVRVVPSRETYIGAYAYDVGGGQIVSLSPNDVIHFKETHPLDDWYGMPPLMPASGRVDIDNYMKDFVKSAFQNGGMPGAVLNVKQKVNPEAKEEIRNRFRNQFGGPAGWHELLIIDNAESTYTPMTMPLGQRGLVVPELDDVNIQRICSSFHCFAPLLGYMKDSGGYNSLFALERHWWTSTLIPFYKQLAGPLNLNLVPDFPRINEVAFDMSDVWALREDMDAIATRWVGLAREGIASLQEAREKVGLPHDWDADAIFLVPAKSAAIKGDELDDPTGFEAPAPAVSAPATALLTAPRGRGRPRIEEDSAARETWEELQRLRGEHPGITLAQCATYLALSERTLQRYDKAFASN